MKGHWCGNPIGKGVTDTGTGALNETGYSVVVCTTFVSELLHERVTRTGEQREPSDSRSVPTWTGSDDLPLGVPPLGSTRSPVGRLEVSTLVP